MNTNVENHPLKESISQSETIAGHFRVLQEADKQLADYGETQRVARDAIKSLQTEWVDLLQKLERLKAQLADAREALRYGEEQADVQRAKYFGWEFGTSNLEFLNGAKNVAALVDALPILKDRVAWKKKLLAQHVEQVCAFGREHGIDQETLKQISGAVS